MKAGALAVVVLVAAACTKHEEQATSATVTLPSTNPTVTATAKASSAAPSVDAAAITTCTATFSCGLSHPGLGTSSRTTSVDLGKCERTKWSDSGPYDPTSPRNPPPKTTSKVAPADCERLRDLAALLGPNDARAASESAHMDSEACSLSIACVGEATPRFDVQRQTITGPTRVEQTIRAVLGMAP